MYFWIIVALAVTVADQISKVFISSNFSATDHVVFIPGLMDIVYVKNTGAAFSILREHTWLLGIISVLFCIGIAVYMLKKKPKDRMLIMCAGLLLGGALGNGIDRIVRGFVVDFFEVTLFKFPVFNVADIAITVGAAMLAVYLIATDKRNSDEKSSINSGE